MTKKTEGGEKMSKEIEKMKAFEMESTMLSEMIAENLEGEKISVNDLIKVERDGKDFVITNAEGTNSSKEFEGVIIYKHNTRSYWAKSFDDGDIDAPPDCSSEDGNIGVGEPGGECESCPMAQFGSDGNGQACKKHQRLYVLLQDDLLPVVLNIPTGSLRKAKSYYLSLAQKGVPYYGVVTSFTITDAKNKQGIKYPEVNFSVKKFLSPDEIKSAKSYKELFQKIV
jgi:hypothetical protein